MASDVSRNIGEQLSAFLDGELPDEELQLLVRRLERDEEYRAMLERYSLIGNILRNDPVQPSAEKFRSGIMAAVDTEAESLPTQTAVATSWSGRRRALASVAIIALLAVGLVNTGFFNSVDPTENNAQVAAVSADNPAANPVVKSQVLQVPQGRRASIDRERMTSYLVSHREYARSFQGPMANPRIFVQQASFEER